MTDGKPHVGFPPIDRLPVINEIVERLSKGEPLAQICRDGGMPSTHAIRIWMQDDEDIAFAIACAREDGFDQIAVDTLLIADDSTQDYDETDVGPKFNAEHVQRAKLRVDTRLKLLSKWDPKRYGEATAQTTVNLTNAVNVLAITEDRRKELIEKRRAANERLKALKGKTLPDTPKG